MMNHFDHERPAFIDEIAGDVPLPEKITLAHYGARLLEVETTGDRITHPTPSTYLEALSRYKMSRPIIGLGRD